MRSVSCAPVGCVDGFVWIVIGGFWCTSIGFYASTGIKRCRRVSLRQGERTVFFRFISKTRKRSSFIIGRLVTAETLQIKMACAALAFRFLLTFESLYGILLSTFLTIFIYVSNDARDRLSLIIF